MGGDFAGILPACKGKTALRAVHQAFSGCFCRYFLPKSRTKLVLLRCCA